MQPTEHIPHESARAECPVPESWRRFVHGHLPEADAASMGGHLDECGKCLDVLTEISDDQDTIVDMITDGVVKLEEESWRVYSPHHSSGPAALSQWRDAADLHEPSTHLLPSDIPPQLGEYRLLEPLGDGAVGRVFKAEHQRLRKMFAVKILAPKRTFTSDLAARFEREMQAVGQIEHANVIGATDAGEADGLLYLVMEYLDGLDLATVAARLGWLSVPDACEVVRQGALGIQAAHDRNLIHRDVKLSNLLLTERGVVKVLDLGLVALKTPDAMDRGASARHVVGTPNYMAPEQWQGHAVDGRADVFGLGCTLYKLLTGRVPYKPSDCRSTEPPYGAGSPAPPNLARYCEAPPVLCEIVEKALALDAADRIATPAELAEQLTPLTEKANLPGVFARAKTLPLAETDHDGHDITAVHAEDAPGTRTSAARFSWLGAAVPALIFIALAATIGGTAFTLSRSTGPRWLERMPEDLEPIWSDSRIAPEIKLVRGATGRGIRITGNDRTFLDVGRTADESYALRTSIAIAPNQRSGMFFVGSSIGQSGFHAFYAQVWRVEELGNQARYVLTLRSFFSNPDESQITLSEDASVAFSEFFLPADRRARELEIRVHPTHVRIHFDGKQALRLSRSELATEAGRPIGQLFGAYGLYAYSGQQSYAPIEILDY